jgi:hypothetical protein
MQNDKQALLNDIFDYLFENDFDIGTNFKNDFPKSYFDEKNNKIVLIDKNNSFIASINLNFDK